jgi:hypothetical protein
LKSSRRYLCFVISIEVEGLVRIQQTREGFGHIHTKAPISRERIRESELNA